MSTVTKPIMLNETGVRMATAVEDLIDKIDERIAEEAKIRYMLGHDYDETETYLQGAIVVYDDTLFRCITNIDVAEEWDETHWIEINVSDIIMGWENKPANGWAKTDFTTAVQNTLDLVPEIDSDVNVIESKIPAQASASNRLADKDFVNSSIATNTAYYISNNGLPFGSLAALQSYAGIVTNNDYAFVSGTDAQGNPYYDRYKATVSGDTTTWALEYRLNNSSFTAAQWASISSGITSNGAAFVNALSHETWTFTLDDYSTVTKEMVKWTQPV